MLRALKKNQSEHPPLELIRHSLIEAAEYRIQVGTRKKQILVHSKPSHVLLQISSRPKAHEAHHPQRGNTCPQGMRFPQNMRLRAIIIESS
jgi:hypothetical protein